jgi:hypothetical protein
MNQKKQVDAIATISFEINPGELEKIAESGRLEEFTTRATELFSRQLKFELVKNRASSGKTSFYLIDDEYGTMPRPPWPPGWLDNLKLDAIVTRLDALEKTVFNISR